MGWTGISPTWAPTTHAETKAFLTKEFNFVNKNGSKSEVLAISSVGSTWYLAVKVTPVELMACDDLYEMQDGSYVYALIVLTGRSRGEFLFKDMAETSGPNESKAPMKILNLLSPLKPVDVGADNYKAWAHNWRERCRKNAAAKTTKLVEGMKIRLAAAVKFNHGVEEQEFVVTSYHRRGQNRRAYLCANGGGMVRLAARHLEGMTVI